jgi:iron-sulfur cluster insertion protein
MPITVTEKAAGEVKRIIEDQKKNPGVPEKVYLRLRVVGGGCSGFQNKLDLDPECNPKLDEVFEFHGVPVVVDKRSLMYLTDVTVDFHEDLNRRGFSISNPAAKGTCGCGSSYSM